VAASASPSPSASPALATALNLLRALPQDTGVIRETNSSGETLLHLAARVREDAALSCVHELMRLGADPNVKSKTLGTPLQVRYKWCC
jgi:ankyrin repeat protein